jgi:hypothetical protein
MSTRDRGPIEYQVGVNIGIAWYGIPYQKNAHRLKMRNILTR